jgi:small-conductance mechanosensitive channel
LAGLKAKLEELETF